MLSLPSPLALLAWVACRTVGAYCVPAVSFPTESLAVQEARAQFAQRTLTTESACVRKRQEPMSEVNALFAYGETELAEAGRQQLAAAAAWLKCIDDAAVRLEVHDEPHYRHPDVERELRDGRLNAAVTYLLEEGIEPARIVHDDQPALASDTLVMRIHVKGRGW